MCCRHYFYEILYFKGTLPHKHKVVIAGNHDMTFDLGFLHRTWSGSLWKLANYNYQSRLQAFGSKTVHDMMTNCIYLQDSMVEIYGVKIYGSPWLLCSLSLI